MGAIAAVVCAAGVAHANPWSEGVTDEQKARAKQALDEGNALFLEKRYVEALAKYEAAIAAWDHPAIRFNVVRCQIQLDRIVEAAENLERALKYGAAPLEPAVYAEALSYAKLFANQIGEIVARCDQPGVRVTLDGQPFVTCPGSARKQVEPGTHQLVGVKDGLLTRTLDVVVVGGATQDVRVTLAPPESAARIEHRWPKWIPWTVFGGGLGLLGAGVLLNLSAASQMDAYELFVEQNCDGEACTEAELASVDGIRDSAELRSRIAVGIMAGGAAAVATGAVMLYLNRGRTVYEQRRERVTPAVVSVPGGSMITVRGTW